MEPTNKVTEKPILFSGKMVREILNGHKTQTRRVIKPLPPAWLTQFGYTIFTPDGHISGRGVYDDNIGEKYFRCPYGKIGGHLWVRETWGMLPHPKQASQTIYKADNEIDLDKWKPSIHMPRWASRITLKVTDIRVERLQSITDGDVAKEGVTWGTSIVLHPEISPARKAFKALWNEINAKRGFSWDVNPWVWVVSFEVIE